MNKFIVYAIALFTICTTALAKDCGELNSCGVGAQLTCCAPGYICSASSVCVYDPNELTKMKEKQKIPNLSATNPPVAAKAIAPPEINVRGNYLPAVNTNSDDVFQKAKNADKAIYKNLPKGNYVRCYDGSVSEIKGPSKASLHLCQDKGGVYEYKVNQ